MIILVPSVMNCSAGGKAISTQVLPVEIEQVSSLEEIKNEPEKVLTLAQSYFGRQQYDEALVCVRLVIGDFEGTLYSDHAYYMRGLIYVDILNFHRDIQKAAAAFRMVISSPPESDFDKLAQTELDRIKDV
ncbi:tol-pal system YbgF family protein [candidate division KSB1 bacterium]